jgi:hypothetical protein
MIISTCPTTDSEPHDIFDSACSCGCKVEFVEGDMLIHHQPHDPGMVEMWGVFQEYPVEE